MHLRLLSAAEAHSALLIVCEELKQKLNAAEADKQSQNLKMTAEVDDLNRTKVNLEERLIELIRYAPFGLRRSVDFIELIPVLELKESSASCSSCPSSLCGGGAVGWGGPRLIAGVDEGDGRHVRPATRAEQGRLSHSERQINTERKVA